MAMTMKGFMKGLRYISQIFDEEEEIEEEIEIGLPTDVKHVAHIGADGPSAFNAPSWVKEFQTQTETDHVDTRDNIVQNCIASHPRELPKPTRHDLMDKSGSELPKKKESKSKQPRKKSSKDLTEGTPSQNLPDVPKKSRRKKSKEVNSVGAPPKLRLKADMPNDSCNS